jgi:cytochrome b561
MTVIHRYTPTAIALHWLIAAIIGAAFVLGLIMSDMPGLSMTKLKYFSWHKWMGVTIFMLALLRVLWRVTHPAPPLSAGLPAWQRLAASATHLSLYLLMIVIPLTGYFYSLAAGVQVVYLGIIPLPVLIAKNDALKEILKETHSILNFTMAGLVALHALGALKHQFIDRDGTLARMLPFLSHADGKKRKAT